MTRSTPTFSLVCLLLILGPAACVLDPGALDAGLDDEGTDGTGDGDGDGDGDAIGDGDGDGDGTGDGDGEPAPFECMSASALDGSPAELPEPACPFVCDEAFVGGQTLPFEWSIDADIPGTFVEALLHDPVSSRMFTVERLHGQQWSRIRWFDADGVDQEIVELPEVASVRAAVIDDAGIVYLIYPSIDPWLDIEIRGIDPATGDELFVSGVGGANGAKIQSIELAAASDGFASVLHDTNDLVVLDRFSSWPNEPLWSALPSSPGQYALLDVASNGAIAITGPNSVAFYSATGLLVDEFPQGVDKNYVTDIVMRSPTSFIELAFGPQPDALDDMTDALVTLQNLDGSFVTRPYRWGALDCELGLVASLQRLWAVDMFEDGGFVAVGWEGYGPDPDEPTLPRIIEFSPSGEVVGGARLLWPEAAADQVLAVDDAFYVAVRAGHDESATYQLRKYLRAPV